MARKNVRKILALAVAMTLCLVNMIPSAMAVEVSDKVEISGKENIDMDGYNSIVVKQSTGSIIWVENEEDVDNQELIDEIRKKDPSIKDNYVVVSGKGEFNFSDYFDGNQYKNTSIKVDGNGVTITGDYSHASPFTYNNGEPTTQPTKDPVEPTTAEPTTVEPTTAEPTTAEPTTAEPTTAEPTTAEPTTAEPTTAEPTTAEPTTAEPTTAEPTTAEPTTAEPTTAEPTTRDDDDDDNDNPPSNPTVPTEPDEPVTVEIPDPPIPVAPPEQADESPAEELVDIPEDIPLADVPVTGDMVLLYTFASSICGLALVACTKKE